MVSVIHQQHLPQSNEKRTYGESVLLGFLESTVIPALALFAGWIVKDWL